MTSWTPHPDDRLSALVDGELDPIDAAEIRAHLLACSDCIIDLDGVRDARTALRSLPAVEPPPEFLDRLLAELNAAELPPRGPARVIALRTPRAAATNVAAAVVAGLLLVGAMGGRPADAIAPEVDGAVERHASTVAVSAGLGGGLPFMSPTQVTGTTAPPRRTEAVSAPYVALEELAGYRLVGAFAAPRGVHLLYERGRYGLSVFQEEGHLDFDDLPLEGRRMEIDGASAWRWEGPTAHGRVLVVQHGDVVVTLVGDESHEAVLAAAEALGPSSAPAMGFGDRVRRASAGALEALSPAG